MFRIMFIFVIWIGWFGHHPIRGKSTAPSIISMVDSIKSVDNMKGKKPISFDVIKERLVKRGGDDYDYSLINKANYIDTRHDVLIVCKKCGLTFLQKPQVHLRGSGCPKCGNQKISLSLKNRVNNFRRQTKCYGVGICDVPFSTYSSDKIQRAYKLWSYVIARCCNNSVKEAHKTYKDCSICNEWLLFSNFLKWFEDANNGYIKGYAIDKDILIKGNKIYSPDTCCFVPTELNSLLTKSNATRGIYPIGVIKRGHRFSASVSLYGKSKKLGMFDTPSEAFQAYKSAKESYIKDIATQYFNDGKITKKVYNALMNYKVEITD